MLRHYLSKDMIRTCMNTVSLAGFQNIFKFRILSSATQKNPPKNAVSVLQSQVTKFKEMKSAYAIICGLQLLSLEQCVRISNKSCDFLMYYVILCFYVTGSASLGL